MAVEHGRDDPAVDEAEPIVVLRPRRELGDDDLALDIALQVEAVGVRVPAPEARELRVQRLLDARRVRHVDRLRRRGPRTLPGAMPSRDDGRMSDAIWTDATAQAEGIRTGAISATELVQEHLARIDRFDPVLRADVSVDADRALSTAWRADALVHDRASSTLPPFLGVTISLKDVVDAEGLPTTQSSKVLADHVATVDDPLVERLRHAGFVVLGKSNVPEFCTSMTSSELNGICRNPWDTDRTPGGSSGGAAAGLAARLCAVAHGTDGAGSVRVPASFCGLVGVKPTCGLVGFGPERGNPYYATSVDGILSHSVRDAGGLLDTFVGLHDPEPSWSGRPAHPWSDDHDTDPGRLRVAVTTAFPFGEVTDVCADAARTARVTSTGSVTRSWRRHLPGT